MVERRRRRGLVATTYDKDGRQFSSRLLRVGARRWRRLSRVSRPQFGAMVRRWNLRLRRREQMLSPPLFGGDGSAQLMRWLRASIVTSQRGTLAPDSALRASR